MPNMDPKKCPMPSQEPNVRNKNFKEVALGYTEEMAVNEAKRCLQCKNHPCRSGCPVEIDIPGFIKHVAEGDFEAAYNVIAQSSALPAVCGRVCPQEHQCEGKCVRGIKGEAVGIGRLERFVADWYRNNVHTKPTAPAPNGHKVAVIGAGPSGLTVAGDLAKLGYKVTVYEALHVAGGVLMYGIPEFRLPKDIVQHEVEGLKELGVDIETNMVIGKVLTIDELMNDYGFEAVYVASGAGLPRFMGIPGESLNGVYSANEYLTRVNLMKAYKENSRTPIMKSKSVAVVGGGNVAMDAARCAKRLGAENVYIVYRRGMAELPARKEEVEHAEEEGIVFKTLTNPTEVLGDENGWVKGMTCVEMELGEPDASGRRRPIVKEGSEFVLNVDTMIMALGTSPNPLIRSTTPGLDADKHGCLITNGPDGLTSRPMVYAGGDAMRGPATVVEGIADAAAFAEAVIGKAHTYDIPEQAYVTKADAEAKKGVLAMSGCICCEGERCLQCATVCENCVDSCPNRANVTIRMADGSHQIVHVDKMCNECGNCTQFCPYASEPCHDKFTLFQTAEDMVDSRNAGVLFLGGDKVRVRTFGEPKDYDLSGKNELPADLEKLIVTIRDKYGYLYN